MRHSRPEFLYFWFYFIIVNGVWIVVPLACILYACKHINAAVARWVGLG
jgi:cholestenol delta-isomerase